MGRKNKVSGAQAERIALILLITFIWVITCVAKNVWPFGQMVIDVGDMEGQCVPLYTYLWDVMHGHKSLLFDWDTGLGNNMIGAALHFGLVSPFNLFFWFVKRSAVESSMSIYILIKLIAIGLSMRFVLRKWIPGLSGRMCVSFSLLYVFCVSNMQYYYAVMWLDVSFMFPLVMYSYFLLMNERKSTLYVVCLAVTSMMSFQHTYMLFVMLLLLSGILPLLSKQKYRGSLPNLLVATLIAMMISAWIWIPGTIHIMGSTRPGLSASLTEIYNSIWIFYTTKWMKLLNLGIPMAFFITYAIKHPEKKCVKFFGFMGIALCAPICLESTNILWHGGPYQGYSMRFSYMLAFWILIAGAYMFDISSGEKNSRTKSRNKWISNAAVVCGLLLLSGILVFHYALMKDVVTLRREEIPAIAVIFIVGATVCVGFLLCNRAMFLEKAFIFIVAMQSLTVALTSIWVLGEKENTFFAVCSDVAESGEDYSPVNRIKNLDPYGNVLDNYPLIMHKSGPSCVLGVHTRKQVDSMAGLGYRPVHLRMCADGGTLFSDALLGIKEMFSCQEVNNTLYQYQNTHRNFRFFKCLYQYDDGIKIANPISLSDYEGKNPFESQNQIAKELLGRELFDVTLVEGNEAVLTIGGESVLYLYTECDAPLEEAPEMVTVTDLKSGVTHSYELSKDGWEKGVLELGTWENASLKIEIAAGEELRETYYATLNLQDFRENQPAYFDNFQAEVGKSSMNIMLEGAGEKEYLFLPVFCDDDWKCSVNGRRTEIKEFAGFLMAIPLQAGKNEIEMSFVPIGFRIGVCITVLGLILLLVFWKLPMKQEWESAGGVLFVLDEVAFAVLMLVFYILPVIFFMKETLRVIFFK